jgi:hypothetical protein
MASPTGLRVIIFPRNTYIYVDGAAASAAAPKAECLWPTRADGFGSVHQQAERSMPASSFVCISGIAHR